MATSPYLLRKRHNKQHQTKAMEVLGCNHSKLKAVERLGIDEAQIDDFEARKLNQQLDAKRQQSAALELSRATPKARAVAGSEPQALKLKRWLSIADSELARIEKARRCENISVLSHTRSNRALRHRTPSKAHNLLGLSDDSRGKAANRLGIAVDEVLEAESEAVVQRIDKERRKTAARSSIFSAAPKARRILSSSVSHEKLKSYLGINEADLAVAETEVHNHEEELKKLSLRNLPQRDKKHSKKALSTLGINPSCDKLERLGFNHRDYSEGRPLRRHSFDETLLHYGRRRFALRAPFNAATTKPGALLLYAAFVILALFLLSNIFKSSTMIF